MKPALAALACLLALTPTGCGKDSAAPSTIPTNAPVTGPPVANVEGRLLARGSRADADPTPVAGKLTFTAADGTVGRAEVGDDGHYEIGLNPGRYTITGKIAATDDCATSPAEIELVAGTTTTADVTCQLK